MKKKPEVDSVDAFFNEVSEEVKSDNLKKIWDKYGLGIIAAMAIILTIAVSFETFKAWKDKRNQTWADTYSYALSLQNQGKYDESMAVLNKMIKANHGIYGDIARLQSSNILFEEGKNSEALNVLDEIVKDKNVNPKMREMATIKLVSYKLDTAPKEEIATMLNPIAESDSNWNNIAKEMLAMLAIREENIEEAKNLYNQILETPNLADALKTRVQDMLALLEENKN